MKKAHGILAVIGSSAAIFWPGAFIFGYPGVMGPLWQQRFGVGRGAIGNTLFFVLAAVGCFMFFVGRWQERWGTRKLITLGALLCGLNTFLIAYADRLWLLYLWAFLNGAASSFIYIPGLTTVQRWFPEKRGLVSGLVNLVFGLSAAIMAPIFGYLLQAFGYRTMNLFLGGAALLLGLAAAQFTEMPGRDFQPADRKDSAGPPVTATGPSVIREGSPPIRVLLVSMADLGADGGGGYRHGLSGRALRALPRIWPRFGGNHPDGLQPDQRLQPPDHGIPFR